MKSIHGTFSISTEDDTDTYIIANRIISDISNHEVDGVKITSLTVNYYYHPEKKKADA